MGGVGVGVGVGLEGEGGEGGGVGVGRKTGRGRGGWGYNLLFSADVIYGRPNYIKINEKCKYILDKNCSKPSIP